MLGCYHIAPSSVQSDDTSVVISEVSPSYTCTHRSTTHRHFPTAVPLSKFPNAASSESEEDAGGDDPFLSFHGRRTSSFFLRSQLTPHPPKKVQRHFSRTTDEIDDVMESWNHGMAGLQKKKHSLIVHMIQNFLWSWSLMLLNSSVVYQSIVWAIQQTGVSVNSDKHADWCDICSSHLWNFCIRHNIFYTRKEKK